MAMKILAVTADGGGCAHYRLTLPLREMKAAGHSVHVDLGFQSDKHHAGFVLKRSGEIGARVNGEDQYGFELVVFQRWMEDRAPDIIRRARSCGQIVVNDVDDWLLGIPSANRAFDSMHPALNPQHNTNHYRKVLAASDAITVSTPYLAERLKNLGRPVYVLRNYIDFHRWQMRRTDDTTSPSLGWVGATSYRSPGDLAQLRGVVGPYLTRHTTARLHHVGSEQNDGFAEQVGVQPERIDRHPRSSVADLPAAMQPFDVALAPLEDAPFNHAKSYIKALEASAAGIPFVASDMPEYRMLHDGKAGILCRRPKDWVAALERLTDPEERMALSLSGRLRAAELDITKHWHRWEKVYAGLIGTPHNTPTPPKTPHPPETPTPPGPYPPTPTPCYTPSAPAPTSTPASV